MCIVHRNITLSSFACLLDARCMHRIKNHLLTTAGSYLPGIKSKYHAFKLARLPLPSYAPRRTLLHASVGDGAFPPTIPHTRSKPSNRVGCGLTTAPRLVSAATSTPYQYINTTDVYPRHDMLFASACLHTRPKPRTTTQRNQAACYTSTRSRDGECHLHLETAGWR